MSVRDRIKRMEQMAMEEREGAPDERGRSPGGVSMASNTSASGSPRPLSKVRTSFVAIADKDGRIGLTRHPSGDSNNSGRKLSGDTEAAASSSIILENSNNNSSNNSRYNVLSSSPDAIRTERTRGPSFSVSSAILEDAGPGTSATGQPAEPPVVAAAPGTASGPESTKSAGAIASPRVAGPATASAATANPESLSRHGPVANSRPTNVAPAAALGSESSRVAAVEGQKELAASPQIIEASKSEEQARGRVSGRTGASGQRAGGRTDSQGQAVEKSKAPRPREQSQAQTKRREDAPDRAGAKQGGRNGITGANGATSALNGADKAKATKPIPASSTHQNTVGKAPEAKEVKPAPAAKKPIEKKAATSNTSTSFVKPRPKSPTQPIKLPERLTTHTTASATRTRNGAPPVSLANRPASRTSMGSSGKTLGRSSSVTGRQHSSFGPPPKQTTEHAVPKDVKPVDESFLARMMRPTQAYANKVADKVQMPPKTPPHSIATRKPASARTGPAKTATKSIATSAAASPETKQSEQFSAVKHIAKKVEAPVAEETPSATKTAEEQPAPDDSDAIAEEGSKQKEQILKPVSVSEKTEPPEPETIETKQEASKAAEQIEAVSELSEKEDDAEQTTHQRDESAKPSETDNVLPSAKKVEEAPQTTGSKDEPTKLFDNSRGVSLAPDEQNSRPKAELASKSSESAQGEELSADAKFALFMNPESGKVDASSKANENHKENSTDSAILEDSKAEVKAHQLVDQSGTNGSVDVPHSQQEEEEEW
ncbi:unnamed protein product [Discula destructiva]